MDYYETEVTITEIRTVRAHVVVAAESGGDYARAVAAAHVREHPAHYLSNATEVRHTYTVGDVSNPRKV